MTYLRFSVTAAFVTVILAGCANAQSKTRTPSAPAPMAQQAGAANQGGDIRIAITTTKGEIQATLYASKVPMTVANFVNLAQKKYYDGIIFHRVIPDFMAQVGDPLTRDPRMERRWGTGGPGYTFADEIDRSLRHSRPGIFSMANSGPGTNGSQIFITHVPTPHLDGKHAVFGAVTQGMDVLLAITKGDKIVEVKVLDDTSALLMSQAEHVKKWNMALEGPNRDF